MRVQISAAVEAANSPEASSFKSEPGGAHERGVIEGTGSYENGLQSSRRASEELERISAAADVATPGHVADRLSSIESVASSEAASPDGGGSPPPAPLGADRP